MALTVEDGTQVTNANTYISDVNFTDYCDARGLTYPATDSAREQLIIKAKDYLEGFRRQFQGFKVSADQALQWPRTGVYLDDYPVDSDEIPQILKDAQSRIAFDLQNGSFQAVGNSREVKSEEVQGAVRVEYFQSGSNVKNYRSKAVEDLLSPLLRAGGGAFFTVRV